MDVGLLIPQFDSPINSATGEREATPWVSHPDNVSDFFDTGYTYSTGLSVSNSDDKFDYRVSYNYEYQKGVVPYSRAKKTNIAFNGNYRLSKKLSVGASGNYIINDIPNYPGGSYGQRASGVMLQFLWFGRQANMQSMKDDWSITFAPQWYSNPFWRAYNNVYSQKRNRLVGNVNFTYDILPGLKFTFEVSQDRYSDDREYKIAMETAGTPNGSYMLDQYEFSEVNYDAMLHYTKDLNKDFSLDVLLEWNKRSRRLTNLYNKASSLSIDGLYTMQSASSTVTTTSSKNRICTYSLFGSAQLGFRNYAFLNVTGRNDWSSTLPSGNNSYFYPSVNASVVLTDMLNIKSPTLSFLKVRAGWSQVGNDAEAYQLKNTFESDTSFDGNPLLTINTAGKNDDLKPEITSSTEVGLEAAFFNNRLHFDAAYYYTTSRDQILSVETSASSGSLSKLMNAGKITNKGFELQVSATPIQNKKFSWDLALNFATNKSKVVELDKAGQITSYTMYTGTVQVVAEVGEEFGMIKGSTYTRDNDGNIVVDSNGLPIVNNTYSNLGKYSPDWTDRNYPSTDQYEVTTDDFTDLWDDGYATIMANMDAIIAGEVSDNWTGVASIMRSWILLEETMAYGYVPYSEAGQGSTPVYNSQEDVLNGLNADLKEAVALLDTSDSDISGDLMFDGDVEKWERFGNSLRLRIALIMSDRDSSTAGTIFQLETTPVLFMTYAEVLFCKAEACARGLMSGDAGSYYEAAITASMEQYDIDDSNIAIYLANPDVAYNSSNYKESIGIQKWLALYTEGLDAFTEYRRLDFPQLTPAYSSMLAEGELPVRFYYPSTEQTLNGENYSVAIAAQGAESLTTKLWFDMY